MAAGPADLPEPQWGEVLVKSLESLFARYLSIDARVLLVLACWSIATHLFAAFDAFAYIAITSPTKRCGKTRASELLELVCLNPLRTVGITAAALFRLVELKKPTLIIDEAETLRSRDEKASAVREILNAGYRAGQKVWRCNDAKAHEPQSFETYCPKVLVLIGNLTDTLSDRCIPVAMRRRNGGAISDRFRMARVREESAPVRTQISEWTHENAELVKMWYLENALTFVEDREEELWLPLFAVCAIAAPSRLAELESTARQIAGLKSAAEPTDFGIKLLDDIKGTFESKKQERLSTLELLQELNCSDESPWSTWVQGRELNARGLASLLRPFGIHSQNVRTEAGVLKGYSAESFKDAWERYLPGSGAATPLQSP